MILGLTDEFSGQVKAVLKATRKAGYVMKPFYGLRSVESQAKLWRQSRSKGQIKDALAMLRKREAGYLAGILEAVGPQYGRWATNALPGQSWHNYGRAVDCFYLHKGKADWTTMVAYEAYAKAASGLGLIAGHFWKSKDSVHIQGPLITPLDTFGDWSIIDAEMQRVNK